MSTFHMVKAEDLQVGDVLALPFEQYIKVMHITFGRNNVTVRTRSGITTWGRFDEMMVQNTTKHNLVWGLDGDFKSLACEICGQDNVSEDELCPEADA